MNRKFVAALLIMIAASSGRAEDAPAPAPATSFSGNTLTFRTSFEFQAALNRSRALFNGINHVSVDSVATPSPSYATCGVTYARQSTAGAVPGTISGAGAQWVPQYTLDRIETCQFGVYGNGSYPVHGVSFTASGNGSNVLTTTAAKQIAVGYRVESVNWHSIGAAAITPSLVTAVAGNTVTLDHAMPASSSLSLVATIPLTPAWTHGADMTGPLKAVIAFAIANNVTRVHLADGVYELDSDTLQIGSSALSTIEFYGGETRPFMPRSQAGGAFIICTKPDRPCLNFRNARNSSVHGIGVYGPAYSYVQWSHVYPGNVGSDKLDWLEPAFRATGSTPGGWQQHSPLAAITVDACADAAPAAPYGGCAYGDGYSTGVSIRDVVIGGFPLGVGSGLNTNAQGDYLVVKNVLALSGVVAVMIGNSQARLTDIDGVYGAGFHSLVSNDMIGMGTGALGSTMRNLQCAECYEGAHINLAYSGPVAIDGYYSENSATIAEVGGGSRSVALTMKNLLVNMYEVNTHMIPPCYFNIGAHASIILDSPAINGSNRITNLACGGGALTIEHTASLNGAQAGPGGSAAIMQAANATGGLFAGEPYVGVNGATLSVIGDNIKGSYFNSPSAAIGFGYFGENISFLQDGALLARSQITQYSKGWVDSAGYRWTLRKSQAGQVAGSGQIGSTSISGDVLKFTLPGSLNHGPTAVRTGWILYYSGAGRAANGTDWVVTSVTCAADCAITAKQQNNMYVDEAGNFAAQSDPNLAADIVASGWLYMIPTDQWAPLEVEYGAFSGKTVASLDRGDGTCPNLAIGYSVGDIYYAPSFSAMGAMRPWPFQGPNNNTITAINAAACSVSFSDPVATLTLGPLLPIPAY